MNTNLIFGCAAFAVVAATIGCIVLGRQRDKRAGSADVPRRAQGMDLPGPPGGLPAPTDSETTLPLELADMLAKPQLLEDPVFPKTGYLQSFGTGFFRSLLRQSGKGDMVERVHVQSAKPQSVMLLADHLAFWAIDLEATSGDGLNGRDEFVERVKNPIRRPPPAMAAFTAEQHILSKGAVRIQVEEEPPVPGQFQICRLKTVGWCLAALMSPQAGKE